MTDSLCSIANEPCVAGIIFERIFVLIAAICFLTLFSKWEE